MKEFLEKFDKEVNGVVHGWDRIALRGTIRWLASTPGVLSYIQPRGVLLKHFSEWAERLTKKVRAACDQTAQALGIEARYLQSCSVDKEQIARSIAAQRGIETGPICMLSSVEPSLSPSVAGCKSTQKLEMQMRHRKCAWLYFYFNDPRLGFGHLRLQSWIPFTIQGNINGRHWLERSLLTENIPFIKDGNCFRWIKDLSRAQQLLDEQLRTDWSGMLNGLVGQYFPIMRQLFADHPLDYYWSADATEWASDIMFTNTPTLDRLFPMLARHSLTVTDSSSVMRYLGRIGPDAALPPKVSGELRGDRRRRHEGLCVKHSADRNSVKTYNKAGNVLRIETTINDTRDFKVFRCPNDDPETPASWQLMRKGVADMHRRSQISQASNERYARALAGCRTGCTVMESLSAIARPAERKGKRFRAMNPLSAHDAHLLKFLSQGQWAINGMRNRDLAQWLEPDCDNFAPTDRKRLTARASRLLALLQAHGLIRKVNKTHRYQITDTGRHATTLVTSASTVQATDFVRLAA